MLFRSYPKSFDFVANDKEVELDGEIKSLIEGTSKIIFYGKSDQDNINNVKIMSDLDESKSKSKDTYTVSIDHIAEAIGRNVHKAPLSQCLVKKKAFAMDQESFNILRSFPENEYGIYAIKSYTYDSFIKIPVRGTDCCHYDVVDLEYLIKFIATNGWFCPLCYKPITLNTICIDKLLRKKLDEIRKLADSKEPDFLIVKVASKKFAKASWKSFAMDIQFEFPELLPGGNGPHIVSSIQTPMYDLVDFWVNPDRQHFEVLFEPIGNITVNQAQIIPSVIIGKENSIDAIKGQLISLEQPNTCIVTYAPSMHDYGFGTQVKLINVILSLNDNFKIDRKSVV